MLAPPHPSGALALLEISEAATGLWLSDQVLKKAPVQLLMCKTTEPGKLLLAFTGDVASVEESHEHAVAAAEDALLDDLLLHEAHPRLWRALGAARAGEPDEEVRGESLLAVECFTVASTLRALDRGLKTAPSKVVDLRLAEDYGGKGYFVLSGTLTDLEAVEEAAGSAAGPRLVSRRLIPRPDPDLPPAPGEAITLTLPSADERE